jgi:Protein phosphatase 2C
MKIIDQISSPGGERVNEDRLGYVGGLAWVLDGATDLEKDAFLPGASDVLWLVDRVGELLTEHGRASDENDPVHLLRTISHRIGTEMADLRFPADRIHPTCSVGLLVAARGELRMARIGDPSCVATGTAGPAELSTGFFGQREAEAVARGGTGGLDDDENRRGIVRRRQQYIEGALEESVFSGHPRAGLQIRTSTLRADRFEHVVLCTDGFARAVVDYRLYPDWPGLVASALADGLASVLDRIRHHENNPPEGPGGARSTHFKKSDDVTALLIRP